MVRSQFILDLADELIVDNFAGGGGASTGIELALGRHVDIAINHDREAVAMHSANHPQTQHYCEDVFNIAPKVVTKGRKVGFIWFSPDCKHFSKAKGGKPRSKKIRGLAWVMLKWAAFTRFRVGALENVEEFQTWGPLDKDGDPIPEHAGRTFKAFIACLTTGIDPNHPDIPEILDTLGKDFPIERLIQGLGYHVEWREFRACDYGAPTIRKRFFLIARRDGMPIVWPKPTHANPKSAGFRASGLRPWKTAAQCIDWTLACPSIFLTKEEARKLGVKRPLADNTLRRIAKGIVKFVIEAKEPFIVPLTHQGSDRVEAVTDPFRTITGAHRSEKALVVPYTVGAGGPVYSAKPRSAGEPFGTILTSNHQSIVTPLLTEFHSAKSPNDNRNKPLTAPLPTQDTSNRFGLVMPLLTEHANASVQRNFDINEPMRTQCAEVKGGHFALVSAFFAKHFTGVVGCKANEPIHTITSKDHHSLVVSPLSKLYGTTTGQETDAPLHTITAGGNHLAEVRAFLVKYYGEGGQDQDLHNPLHTVPTRDRFGLVKVSNIDYQIADIGIRMLTPRELYRGQGFPDSYIIDVPIETTVRGRKVIKRLSAEAQVRMCGNSVCPPLAQALVAANVPEMAAWSKRERPRAFSRQQLAAAAA